MNRQPIRSTITLALLTFAAFLLSGYRTPGHTNYHDVSMLIPVGDWNIGHYGHLHCKYHGACATPPAGNGLDWDDWTNVNYKEVDYHASWEWGAKNGHIRLNMSRNFDDAPQMCDSWNVDQHDLTRGILFGTMKYTHSWT